MSAVLQFHCTRTLHVEEWQTEKMQAERGRERVLALPVPNTTEADGRRHAQYAIARFLWVRVQIRAEPGEPGHGRASLRRQTSGQMCITAHGLPVRISTRGELPRGARQTDPGNFSIDPHPGYGDPAYEIPECCTDKVIQAGRGPAKHVESGCTYDTRCMSSQVFERGLQSWINVAEASELMDMPVPSPPGRVKFWEAAVNALRDAEEAEAAVDVDRALCSSNATTTTEEELLCSDLATKQRNVEKARDHENLARLHRDRRDLACSSTANPSRRATTSGGSKGTNLTGRSTSLCGNQPVTSGHAW